MTSHRVVDAVRRSLTRDPGPQPIGRRLLQVALGGFLALAGTSHLTFARTSFQAQVPSWVPMDADAVVLASGVVEIALGLALVGLVGRQARVPLGWLVGAFFVAVFPGNISQLVTHSDAFGLDTDRARAMRLVFQPVLVAWALWSTQAWQARRSSRSQT